MRKFEIITNTTKDPDRSFEKEVGSFLSGHGAEWVTERTEGFEPDCLLVLGGDGTVLRTAISRFSESISERSDILRKRKRATGRKRFCS